MTQFDIEAAKRGEPIQLGSPREGWRDVSYVGLTPNGDIVMCEVTITGREWVVCMTSFPHSILRMKPRKRTIFIVIGSHKGGGGGGGKEPYDIYDSLAYTTRQMAEDVAAGLRNRGRRASVHEAEIEE